MYPMRDDHAGPGPAQEVPEVPQRGRLPEGWIYSGPDEVERKDGAFYCARCEVEHKRVYVQRAGKQYRVYYLMRGPHMTPHKTFDDAVKAYEGMRP